MGELTEGLLMSMALVLLFGPCFAAMDPTDPLDWRNGIHAAARDGNALRVHFLLVRHPELVNATKPYGKGDYDSPVHIAAYRNHVGVLKVLIAHGADVNDYGKSGGNPLQHAAQGRAVEAAEVLLASGAVLDIYSAVALGKRKEVDDHFKLAGGFGLAKRLANIHSRGPGWGSTPLLNWAVAAGRIEMVESLIGYGANVNPYPSPSWAWDQSPLHEAAERDRGDIIELLLKHGAKLEAKDFDGLTALHRAAAGGHLSAAKVLLKHGGRTDNREDFHAPRISDDIVKSQRPSKDTVLHTAIHDGSAKMVALLLAHGADPNARNVEGESPLNIAEAVGKHPPKFDHDVDARRWVEDNALIVKLLYRYGGKGGPPGPPEPRAELPGLTPAGTPTGDLDVPIRSGGKP